MTILTNIKMQTAQSIKEIMADSVFLHYATPINTNNYNKPIEIVQTIDDFVKLEAEGVLTKGSPLLDSIIKFRKINKFNKLFIVPLGDNIAGVAATSTETIVGASTEAKTAKYGPTMSGKVYDIIIANADTAADIAVKLKTAINANPYEYFTADNTAGVLTLTMKHKGSHGNGQPNKVSDFVIAGIDIVTTPFAGGLGDASITTILDTHFKQSKINIICPFANWEEAEAHIVEKRTGDFLNTQYLGHVFVDNTSEILDIATLNLSKPERYTAFITSIIADTKVGEDGSYTNTASEHSFLRLCNVYAATNLASQPNAILLKKEDDIYDNIGGPNQLMRPFGGTYLSNLTLSSHHRKTKLIGQEKLLLQSKGLSYIDEDEQGNIISSDLYLSDLTNENSSQRTLQQSLTKDRWHQMIVDVCNSFSEYQIGAKGVTNGSVGIFTDAAFKKALMSIVTEQSDLYPLFIVPSNRPAIDQAINKCRAVILSNRVVNISNLRILIGDTIELIQGNIQVYTFSQQ